VSTYTLNVTETLSVIACCDCGVTFAMTSEFERRRRADHRLFYCPAGHEQYFTAKSAEEKAKDRAAELARQLASREDDLRAERMKLRAERASHGATKGQLTKVKNRAENGVCQHCHRHFANVARHVAGQHPELVSV
jgi:hypothetical protein